MLESLRAGEKKPEVFRCPDKHYRRVIWGIGPYIADYPEQVLLTCIVQGWCSRQAILSFIINCIPYFFPSDRCQGFKKDLDGELSKYPRSREFTEELVNNLPVMTLWKEFGIIPDVVVCSNFFFCLWL